MHKLILRLRSNPALQGGVKKYCSVLTLSKPRALARGASNGLIPHSRPTLSQDDIKKVLKVLKSGYISQGKFVSEFEQRFSRYLKTRGSVAVNCGTSALHLGLLALGIKENDEVILPTYVCSAVLNAVLYVGARPKFADINEDDFNISFVDTKRKITKLTKAIILVHMFGSPVDVRGFKNLGVPLIEDCAQAIGAQNSNTKIGSSGNLGVASFYATKLLTTGEGGMLFSDNQRLLDKARDLRDYDKKAFFKLRFNYKMTDFQAALGISQLEKLDGFIKSRRHLAEIYDKAFYHCDFIVPPPRKGRIYFRYVIKTRKNLIKTLGSLRKEGIICERPVNRLLHRYFGLRGNYPHADAVWNSAVSLPIYPYLSDSQQKRVIEVVKKIC